MNNPLGAIRDQVFWRWHKLVDDLAERWQSTQDREDFSDGPTVLIRDGLAAGAAAWSSPDIILVRTSDLPNNQSAAQRQQLGERLFGSAKWDTDFTAAPAQSGNVSLTTTDELVTVISTATLANGRIVKFLNHEPFVYFIRVENTTNQAVAVTARIFLVPTNFENDRTAWIEMDKFTATLAANQNAVLYRALSTCLRCNSALGGSGAVEVRSSGGFRRPGDVVPGGEAVGHLGAIVIGGEAMAAGPETRRDHAEHRQEPLGCGHAGADWLTLRAPAPPAMPSGRVGWQARWYLAEK